MTIRFKLLASFGAMVLIVLLISGRAVLSLSVSHQSFSNYVSQDATRLSLVNEVLDAVNARAIAARNLVLVVTASDLKLEEDAVKAAHAHVGEALAKLETAVANAKEATPKERALLNEIKNVESQYGPVALDIVGKALAGKSQEAVGKMNTECRPLLAQLIEAGHVYLGFLAEQADGQATAAADAYSTVRMLMLIISAAAVAVALVLATLISRGISRSLGAEPVELGDAAKRVASGDLRIVEGAARAPDNSVLASLGEMQGQLAQLVGQVREASDSIASGSANIATGNMDLSQRTENQAASLQETAASMTQMSATVRNNAETAQQATELATSASEAAENGGQVVNEVVVTMEDITSSSRQISDIIGVIDGIAFQTNILALNAAVEAARAGEQGRGFAVVATEVRALASRSIEAAREIKALIEVSVSKVEAGSRLVGNAGTTMEDIVAQAKSVAGLISEISAATNEQTAGIDQVSTALSHLDHVTQQNSALVEESAASAETLRQDADRLAEMVRVFKLSDNAASVV